MLGNHLHLIVEADSSEALSRGLQGLCIRIAKALNAMMDRKGPVFGDHYYSRLLRSPTQLARAIAYLLGNAAHHYGTMGADPFSSASEAARAVLAEARSWLLTVGVRRARFRRPGAACSRGRPVPVKTGEVASGISENRKQR